MGGRPRARWRLPALAGLALVLVVAGAVTVRAAGYGAKEALRPTQFLSFCQEAQKTVAGITGMDGVVIRSTTYTELGEGVLVERSFVKSKSSIVQPLVDAGGAVLTPGVIDTRMYVEYTAPDSGRPKQIRCKMRTAESLVLPGTVASGGWGFGNRVQVSGAPVQSACRRVNEATLSAVQAELADDGVTPVYAPGDISFEDDFTYTTGAGWAYGTDQALTRVGSGLVLRSASVYSPTTGPAGLPANFYAAHYCTFVAPTYLSDVLRGAVTLP